ncbi:cytochrome P450 [Lentithecium fluviatile CBS 122367]|uniref:Cytochrome P450 n=1 Tax=Lentithecium fluviatile CBS 122367 TaxID=1168545 RepID=A0A6G1ISY1_9PLEO|nr:cytochrome P450 [Lentithecium fluviatile CBS 122367]
MSAIVTSDPDNIQAISGPDWGVAQRLHGMKEMLGPGFIAVDGEEWVRARKMLRPAFNKNSIDGFGVLGKVTERVVEGIQEREGVVEIDEMLFDAFMKSSMQFILGLDAEKEGDGRPLTVSQFNELWQQAFVSMAVRILLDNKSWILPSAQYLKACAKLHSFVDFAIDESERRSAKASDAPDQKKTMVDVVRPQARSKEDARNQLMGAHTANQDTTATLTCNAIQLLADHPSTWKQLREETRVKGADLLAYDGLKESKLLHNILFETLRLRPVFPMFGRHALRDVTLPKGGGPKGDQPLHVPKGTSGLMNSWATHFDPAVFGPDVNAFKPDRWNSIKPKTKEFAPFGLGGRACLGREKALVESSYLLVRFAQNFERLEAPGSEWKPDTTRMSMKNGAGYKVVFHTE